MAQAAEEKVNDQQRVILVTGANKGIGLELCKMLVTHKDIRVILACRNFAYVPKVKSKNDKKEADNYEAIGNNETSQSRIEILNARFKDADNIDFVEIDICDAESVKKAAQQIKAQFKQIDILVNNAGMAFKGNAFDSNVVSTTLETNYFGTVTATEALLPLLKEDGRIIMTSSRAGLLIKISSVSSECVKDEKIKQQLLSDTLTRDELEGILANFTQCVEKDSSLKNAPFKQSAYGISKMAMSAYSRILAKTQPQFVAAYCPGWCQTYMSSGSGQRTAANGAKGLELLCVEKKDKKETGKFWGVKFKDSDNDNSTGKLENYNW